MRTVARLFILSAALLAASLASAQTTTRTFPGLTWFFSSSNQVQFTGCTQLSLDATGGSSSVQYSMYGYLFCPNVGGTYLSDGNAYFDASGGFNLQVRLGTANTLLCTGLSGTNFSGACTIYNNSGTRTGDAFINFQ